MFIEPVEKYFASFCIYFVINFSWLGVGCAWKSFCGIISARYAFDAILLHFADSSMKSEDKVAPIWWPDAQMFANLPPLNPRRLLMEGCNILNALCNLYYRCKALFSFSCCTDFPWSTVFIIRKPIMQ